MAELENPILLEEAKSLQCDDYMKNHCEVFVSVVAECLDGALVAPNCANSGGCRSENSEHPPENSIDSCPGEVVWGKSEAKHGVLELNSRCPKELLNSSVVPDAKGVVAMDLLGKGDLGLDLETGKEINGGDDSFWGSANMLLGKALNNFIQGDFGHSIDGSIAGSKKVDPTFSLSAKVDICKPAVDLQKPEVAIQKSESKNGRNVKIAELVGSGKLRHENVNHHIKPGSKKPPRPPRPPRPPKQTIDPSKEKLMKDMLRRVKLERITSLKKKQIPKPKASNSSVWALTLTICFCIVMIMQGIFSPGSGSVQISPQAAVQTSAFSGHMHVNHATNGQRLHAIEQDQASASLYHDGHAVDKAESIQSNPKS